MNTTGTGADGRRRGRRHLVLVSLEWHKDKRLEVAYSAGCLAAEVRAVGVELDVIAAAVNEPTFHIGRLADEVLALHPTDVAVGAYVWNDNEVKALITAFRAAGYGGRIILGGPQVTFEVSKLEASYPEADLFIKGYAEQALAEVLNTRDPAQVKGVYLSSSPCGGVPALPDPSLLCSPYLSGVIPLDRTDDQQPLFAQWETKRGCPYRCAFCQHPGAGPRQQVHMPMERLAAEIALFKARGVQRLDVVDPTFNTGRQSLEVLAELRRQDFTGHLRFECRFERVDDDFLAGIEGLDVRLEFGLQTIHPAEEQAIQRRNNMGKVTVVMRELNRRGVQYQVSLIYGLPNQTLRSFRETVKFCQVMDVPVIRAFPLLLLSGTVLWQQRQKWGLVVGDGVLPEVVESHSFNRKDRAAMADIAARLEQNTRDIT